MKAVEFTGHESPGELQRMAHESGIEVPEGYTHVSTAYIQGFSYMAVTAKDLPAMMFVPQGKEMKWVPMFPQYRVN